MIVRFADDIAENEPVKYYRARQESDGRWHVEGVDDWRYETDELVFHDELPPGVWRDEDCSCWRLDEQS